MGEIAFWANSKTDGQDWDTVVLAGIRMPGIASVQPSTSRNLDIKPSKGKDGPTITDNGYNAAPVAISLTIHNREDWKKIQEIFPKIIHPRKKGGERQPVDIFHPVTSFLGISQIYIRGIKPKMSNQVLTIDLDCVEWFPKPVVRKKPKKSQEPISDEDFSIKSTLPLSALDQMFEDEAELDRLIDIVQIENQALVTKTEADDDRFRRFTDANFQ